MKKKKKTAYYDLINHYIKPYKTRFIVLYIITMVGNVMGLLPVYYMGNIINYVTSKRFDKILYTIAVLCFIFWGSSIFSILETYISNWLNNEITKKIKEDIYNKATTISVTKFQELSSGHIMSLIEGDSSTIADFFVSKIIGILVAAVTLIVSLFFLFKLSISLSIIAIFSFPLGFLGNLLCGKKIAYKSEILRKISDENYTFMNRSLNGIKEIKSYVMEKKMSNKFKGYAEEIQENKMKISKLEIFSGMINAIVSSLADWIIIGYGTWKIIAGTFSIGSYVAFNGYSGFLFNSIKELLQLNVAFRTIEVSLERVGNFLALPDERNGRNENLDSFQNSDIIFKNVTYSYSKNAPNVLQNFSAVFKCNSISVLIGANGIGKSTVFSLIEQFYKPISGEIYIGDTCLKDVKLDYLRSQIGMVQQHPLMLSGTIRENLEYGNKNVSNSILDSVCEEVGLKDFIDSFPNRYDTILGEISGGQQQRIAIARVLLKNPSILLLDEITSDLDGRNEIEIINLLKKLAKTKTIVLISHRINAIVDIPNIYVMDQGKIIAEGKHDDLVKNCFLYSMLVNRKE